MADAYPSGFVGRAAALTLGDLQAAASVLEVGVAKICAVRDVESRGRGFHAETGRPLILFEPHVFHERTAGRYAGAAPDLSYPAWGELPYPVSQAERYRQLDRAMALDASAALKSVSWGMFQVMGFNHAAAGFSTVEVFVGAMCAGEGAQIVAFAKFVRANSAMHNALRLGDWAGFARLYNGKSYARHGYDQRLKVAYAAYRDGSRA